MDYDVIGDIHGHGDALLALLARLGYREQGGAHRHPSRTAVFLGDFIDRGLQNELVVATVRRMVEAGTAIAVMGNHELNAIQYHTLGPNGSALRSHSEKHTKQHESFLEEFAGRPRALEDVIKWFQTIPLYRELAGLRVIHAFWHAEQIAAIQPHLGADHTLTDAGLVATSKQGDPAARSALEDLLKGPEARLPNNLHFKDKEGFQRSLARISWWRAPGTNWRDAVLVPSATRAHLPDAPFDELPRYHYAHDAVPVMFGHYWASGEPEPFAPNAACLDWSVAKGGKLAAYRFDGNPRLHPKAFVWVSPNGA